jgi:hypothetical protein
MDTLMSKHHRVPYGQSAGAVRRQRDGKAALPLPTKQLTRCVAVPLGPS